MGVNELIGAKSARTSQFIVHSSWFIVDCIRTSGDKATVGALALSAAFWIPAFAGMTFEVMPERRNGS